MRGQRRRFASFISWVSVGGLGLGVAVLVVVTSVMNGFDEELKRRILGSIPQLVAYPTDEDVHAAGITPFADGFRSFEADGMIARNGAVNAVAIVGIGDEGLHKITMLDGAITSGSLEALERPGALVLGAPLAAHLGLAIGDDVALVFTQPVGDSVRPRFERFELGGTFEVGAELDYSLVLVGFETITRRELDRAGRIGVRFVMEDPTQLAAARAKVMPELPEGWQITDWTERYGELFRAVRLEKSLMFLLLLLIVAVAAFNIVSAQTMLVHEKRGDIAILRTMGASSGLIMRTVLMQGVIVALVGIGAGIVVGVLLAASVTDVVQFIERALGIRLLDGTYFERVPSRILPSDLVAIVLLSLSLCVASAAVPARRAAALNPAEALHAE
jgi:lipoprotein-releasing system permease protein